MGQHIDLGNGLILDTRTGETTEDERTGQDRRILNLGHEPDRRIHNRRGKENRIPTRDEIRFFVNKYGYFCY